jgi:hypothetical protein
LPHLIPRLRNRGSTAPRRSAFPTVRSRR